MSKKRRFTDDELRCQECGQHCPCDLYGGKEPHGHCPGGLENYVLCKKHEKECLAIHRPIDKNGKWKWIEDCGNPKCGYCRALKALKTDRGL